MAEFHDLVQKELRQLQLHLETLLSELRPVDLQPFLEQLVELLLWREVDHCRRVGGLYFEAHGSRGPGLVLVLKLDL